VTTGRFAPSPSGRLHIGSLRTALLAWCFARHGRGRFLVRMEDLTTPADSDQEESQLRDLDILGIDHDGSVVRQSERTGLHVAAFERLERAGLTYPCFCTRQEIRDAATAPHGPSIEGAYPGTCAGLDAVEREQRLAGGRVPATRVRADRAVEAFTDRLRGPIEREVDDFVLRRGDGVVAYNLAVVVDDADQGIDQVVRGDDLLDTTPRQVLLQRLLGLPTPEYAHVPLALGPDGKRLAKRHGSVGLSEQLASGRSPQDVVGMMAASAGLVEPGLSLTPLQVLERFDPALLGSEPWVWDGR